MALQGKEDIYESEDVEAPEEPKDKDEPADTNIELISIDVDAALKKFGNRILNLNAVDVSDSIAKKRRNYYGKSQYILEVVGNAYEGNETPEQKLNRLVYETAELSNQIKSDPKLQSEMLNEDALNSLLGEIQGLQQKSLHVSENEAGPESAGAQNASKRGDKMTQLEARLKRLEAAVGPSLVPSAPLVDMVEDLKLRCDSLNSAYVEGIETRLNTLVAKLEQVDEKREKSVGSDELEKKVNEIHELMAKWDVACTSLPANTNKVKALNRLHEQGQHFASRLSHLTSIRDQLEKEIAQGRTSVVELQTSAREGIAALTSQLKALEAAVAAKK